MKKNVRILSVVLALVLMMSMLSACGGAAQTEMPELNIDPSITVEYNGETIALADLAANAQVFYAVLEGKVIAASIMLTANGWMNYHLSGSLREYANLAPSNLLLYEAALWGSANGCRTLHMGGGVGSREDSLFKFKKSFYRLDELPQFAIGKKILDQNAYDELVALRGGCEGISFFPQYRG